VRGGFAETAGGFLKAERGPSDEIREAMRLADVIVQRTHHAGRRRILLGAAVLVLASGCTGGLPAHPATAGSIVDVTIKDFAIRAPRTVSTTGAVTFQVYNQGPATHEFVVVHTDLPADELPIGSDGLSVDEDALEGAGEVSQVDTWTTQDLTLSLSPGRYVFFCNLEGHYLGGMHAAIQVEGAK
jgi:uncharacterized cupredoxin-like copper-binding protein